MLTALWFLAILVGLVIWHELGHFLAAKLTKVHTPEFGIGLPPRAWTLGFWQGTRFTLNWLPLGGFVRMWGDDGEHLVADDPPPPAGKFRFNDRPLWARMTIILMGVIFNLLFGIAAFALVSTQIGIPEQLPWARVSAVQADSPAAAAGVLPGDELVRIAGQDYDKSSQGFITETAKVRGQTVELVVRRAGEEKSLSIYVRKAEEVPAGQGSLGIALEDMEYRFYPPFQMMWKGIGVGLRESWNLAVLVVGALRDMVVTSFQTKQVPKDLSGPVGIVHQASVLGIDKQGWVASLNFAGLLSINLAIMNLLPIPALDGGRAVFLLLEPLVGFRRREKWERIFNQYGFLFLIGLILIVTANDIVTVLRER